MTSEKITIMLIDDHQLFREGTRQLLESEESCEVIAVADNVADALSILAERTPDVVLVDINMPDANGFHLMREATALKQMPRILVLTGYSEISYMLTAFQLGAFGFLCKTCGRSELLAAVHTINRGQLAFPPEVFAERGRLNIHVQVQPTKRELEVLDAIRKGLSNKQIAARLFVSERTVHFHVSNILQKLEVSSRTEAAAKGRALGWISD